MLQKFIESLNTVGIELWSPLENHEKVYNTNKIQETNIRNHFPFDHLTIELNHIKDNL